jgi:hypothetical protein
LHAAEEDDADDLSNNFLNFLKKNKEEIVGQDDEEEEEEEEEVPAGDKEEKVKPNLFKEIVTGATHTLLHDFYSLFRLSENRFLHINCVLQENLTPAYDHASPCTATVLIQPIHSHALKFEGCS